MPASQGSMRAILFAMAGFALWVMSDSCMKLAGEANLPSYEVVGILGAVAALSLALFHGSQGKLKDLWPKKPGKQIGRALMTFGCVMANTFALKHLPFTLFYVVVFCSPFVTMILASLFLRERINWPMVAAIIAGFAGVVIAIAPWSATASGDWIGYCAGGLSVLFFAVATVMMRHMTQTETPQSMTFMTGLVEGTIGFCLMLLHGVPIAPMILFILIVMGLFNVLGNLCNCTALRMTTAATVEQFHYTQIITGALIGYIIWHEVPTEHLLIGAAVIIGSGLYVAHGHYKSGHAIS